jgi:hypothetical protein
MPSPAASERVQEAGPPVPPVLSSAKLQSETLPAVERVEPQIEVAHADAAVDYLAAFRQSESRSAPGAAGEALAFVPPPNPLSGEAHAAAPPAAITSAREAPAAIRTSPAPVEPAPTSRGAAGPPAPMPNLTVAVPQAPFPEIHTAHSPEIPMPDPVAGGQTILTLAQGLVAGGREGDLAPSSGRAALATAPAASAVEATEQEIAPLRTERSVEAPAVGGRRIPKRLLVVSAIAALLIISCVAAGGYYLFSGGTRLGRLHLESRPSGARVVKQGRTLGTTPLDVELPTGSQFLEVRGRHSTYTLAITIHPRQEARERVSLPEAGNPAIVTVNTEPQKVTVLLDGEPRGAGPVRLAGVVPGYHTIAAGNDVNRVEREIVVGAGSRVEFTLAVSGWMEVTSSLPVQVRLGGKVIEGTGRVGLSPGRHRVEFLNPELGLRDVQDVLVEAGKVTPVTVGGTAAPVALTADAPSDVFIDGRPAGRTPLTNVMVPLGAHQVRFSSARLGEVEYDIRVGPGGHHLHAKFGAAPSTPPPRPSTPRPPRLR